MAHVSYDARMLTCMSVTLNLIDTHTCSQADLELATKTLEEVAVLCQIRYGNNSFGM